VPNPIVWWHISGPATKYLLRRALCTYTLLRVDWEHEAALAIAAQRTIDTLEAGIAAGGDPEALLDAAEAEDVAEEGTRGQGFAEIHSLY